MAENGEEGAQGVVGGGDGNLKGVGGGGGVGVAVGLGVEGGSEGECWVGNKVAGGVATRMAVRVSRISHPTH